MKRPATNRQIQQSHTKITRSNHHPMNPANLKYHDNYNPQPTTKNTHQQNPPHQPFHPSQPAKTNTIDNQPVKRQSP
jgi:hypothetical protein